jgi:hypothetical protein
MEHGDTSPAELAAAEEAAGILFDPAAVEAIASAARAQADDEHRAEVRELQGHIAGLAARLEREKLQARTVPVPPWMAAFFRPGVQYALNDPLVPPDFRPRFWCVAAALHPYDGLPWASGFYRNGPDAPWHSDEGRPEQWARGWVAVGGQPEPPPCRTPGCGRVAVDADGVDPSTWGWVVAHVAGHGAPVRWWCSAACAAAAIGMAGAELAAAGHRYPAALADDTIPAPGGQPGKDTRTGSQPRAGESTRAGVEASGAGDR